VPGRVVSRSNEGLGIWNGSLTTAGRKRKRSASGGRARPRNDEPPGEGGPEEAVAFIAEQAAGLRRLARRHHLDVLSYLLGMTQLEAEERVRLRSKRRLS
jgi:hypothetical protein